MFKKRKELKMLKNYFVSYWTTDGRKVGMQVSAYSALDAKQYAESLPQFKTLVQYPQPV